MTHKEPAKGLAVYAKCLNCGHRAQAHKTVSGMGMMSLSQCEWLGCAKHRNYVPDSTAYRVRPMTRGERR